MTKLVPINIMVERVAVMDVLDKLDMTPGVAKINFDYRRKTGRTNGAGEPGEEHTPRPARGPYKKYDIKGDDMVARLLYGRPPMTPSQLKDAFEAAGRSPLSIHSLVHNMKKRGDLVLGEQGYSLSKKMRDRLRHRVATKKARR